MAQFCCSSVSKAVINNNLDDLRKLIKQNVRIDVQDNMGYTPVHIAVQHNNEEALDILLKRSIKPVNMRTFDGATCLLLACYEHQPNLNMIEKLLKAHANPNIGNVESVMPIHVACRHKNLDLVKLLSLYNANLNCQDFNKYTPVHVAIEKKSEEIVVFLLEHNANPNLTDLHDLNALMFAIVFAPPNFAELCLPSIENVNAMTFDGKSTLTLAVHKQNIPLVKSLLDRGATALLTDDDNSPFVEAIKSNNYELFEVIWDKVKKQCTEDSDDFIYKCIENWPISNSKLYKLVLSDKNVRLCTGKYIYGRLIFNTLEPVNFQLYKTEIIEVINLFLNAPVSFSIDATYALFDFFTGCPYRDEIMELILNKNFEYAIDYKLLINYGVQTNKNSAIYEKILPHCLQIRSFYVYFIITKQQDISIEITKYFLKFFTPSVKHVKILQKKIPLYNKSDNCTELIETLRNVQVPSLTELSRNVYRTFLTNVFQLKSRKMFSGVSNKRKCDKYLEELEVPAIIKEIITLKIPVNYY